MSVANETVGFHDYQMLTDLHSENGLASTIYDVDHFTFDFENFYHPLVGQLIQKLNQATTTNPIAEMLDPAFLAHLENLYPDTDYKADAFASFATRRIEVDLRRPYASYNWELSYHIPVAIAVHLTKNQRFAEAQKWFHLVFDPTSLDLSIAAPKRYWKFLAFRHDELPLTINQLLLLLDTDPSAAQAIMAGYHASVTTPFQPHAVARTRIVAYQYYVVMKYLDNLIAWGDSLFAAASIETVNEATLCYVLAAAKRLSPQAMRLSR